MRKTILILLLAFPLIGFAQKEGTAKKHKFGVGIGYNFNSVMGDSIRPVEFSLQYRINDRHTLQVYSPIRLKQYKQYPYEYFKTTKTTQHLFGLGIMYDYAFTRRNNYCWVIGIGSDYQWMNDDNFRNYPADDYNREIEWKIKHQVYNFYPYIGFRYSLYNLGIEAFYKPLCSILKSKEDVYYNDYDFETKEKWSWGSYDVPPKKTLSLQSALSIKLFYYF